MRDNQEMAFPHIADWLNDNGYKTPRGYAFTSSHAYSIYSKSKIRIDRYGNTFYSQLKDVKINFSDLNTARICRKDG